MQTSFIVGADLNVTSKTARPFLKWAGGKGQLIDGLAALFPQQLQSGEIRKYAEPFVGGGALFFYVAQSFPHIESFFISDINPELILAYRTIQKDVEKLIDVLARLEKEYHARDRQAQKAFFYDTRAKFNGQLAEIDYQTPQVSWVERTASIIFLNRTCFNGLFRVNARGEFNVPFGDYKNPKICDSDNLRAASLVLQRTQIKCGDFTACRRFVDASTFVYFDPPYRPLSKTASFTSYSRYSFDDQAQERLADYFAALSKKGAKLMLSNSDPTNEDPDDHFFERLYSGFSIHRINAFRMINCDATKRGKIKELIILNY